RSPKRCTLTRRSLPATGAITRYGTRSAPSCAVPTGWSPAAIATCFSIPERLPDDRFGEVRKNTPPCLFPPSTLPTFAIVPATRPGRSGVTPPPQGAGRMSKSADELPRRFVRTKEAAHFVGLCARTMEKHRTYGTGPRYCKIGGRIL